MYTKIGKQIFKRKQIFIYKKIEFQNSAVRLSFLCRITDIKIAWINPSVYIELVYFLFSARNEECRISMLPLISMLNP